MPDALDIFVFVCWFAGGFVSGVSGIGGTMFAFPFLALAIPMHALIPLSCLVCFFKDACMIAMHVRFCRFDAMPWLLLGAVPGSFAGVYLLQICSGAVLQGIVGILLLIVLITWVNGAERRIPVQYAKRQVGRKMYGGQSSTLPMKVNMSGVLPIIFAQSIAMIPSTIAAFCKQPKEGTFWYGFLNAIDTKSVLYMIFYFLMIIAFSYFYATIQFNPVEISNNLKKNGGFIPGFRPGNPTAAFIQKVLNKVTLFGAVYLGIVAILPLIIGKIVNVAALSIGGTSVIIVVGVALETVQALESQMLMRQYKGFLE